MKLNDHPTVKKYIKILALRARLWVTPKGG